MRDKTIRDLIAKQREPHMRMVTKYDKILEICNNKLRLMGVK